METFGDAVTDDGTGVVLALEISPASGRADLFTGYDPWRRSLRCAVGSPPSRGRANRELMGFLAEALGVPVASIRIISGASQARKRVRIRGITKKAVLDRLGELL
jgi:uncharacterized protein (TIGR00251 family)